jgi:hypothetical protein
MKILSNIVVDKLPDCCGNCELRDDNYCPAKCCFTQDSSWINRHGDDRDSNCPLVEKEEDDK